MKGRAIIATAVVAGVAASATTAMVTKPVAMDTDTVAAAVARQTAMRACTTVTFEDGSQYHQDPEAMSKACQHFVGYYVGSGWGKADRQFLVRLGNQMLTANGLG